MSEGEINDLKRVLLQHYGEKLQAELEGLESADRLREVSERLEQGSRTEVRQQIQAERGQ